VRRPTHEGRSRTGSEAETVNVLVLHNAYRQAGGEDAVVAREQALLAAHGHAVSVHVVSNERIHAPWTTLTAGWQAVYSRRAQREVAAAIARVRPEIVHVHNFFPLLTPSVYDACRAACVPVVQPLHNYRLSCVNAQFFRQGRVCEDCLGKAVPWPGVLHACYRQSRSASMATAAMLSLHRLWGTWTTKVDLYVALTEFARAKFIQGGLPAHKVVVKPNFVFPDPGPGTAGGAYVLFVGRLSPEKGVSTLLEAWEQGAGGVPLKLVGDGPLAPLVENAARRLRDVEWLGRRSSEDVGALMKQAGCVICPSSCYEGFPLVVVEAYAVGLPVVASRLGSMASLVKDGETGLHFTPNDPVDLAAKVVWLMSHAVERAEMGRIARAEFERKYTAESN